MEFPVFQFVSVAPCPFMKGHENGLSLSSLQTLATDLCTFIMPPLTLLLSRLNSFSSLNLSPQRQMLQCCNFQYWTLFSTCVFFLAGGTQHQTCSTKSISCTEEPSTPQMCVPWVEQRERVTSLGLLAKAPQDPTGLLCYMSTFLAHGQLGIHQDLQILPCQAAFQPAGPWHAKWQFLLKRKNCFFHLLKMVVSLTALFVQPVEVPLSVSSST